MSQGKSIPGKVYPGENSARSPHASGAGGVVWGYTGAALSTIDCTAIAGNGVNLRAVVQASGAATENVYRFCWITEDEYNEGTPTVAFASADVTPSMTPATKVPEYLGALPAYEVVDSQRPFLMFQPFASVGAAETITVSVSEPIATA